MPNALLESTPAPSQEAPAPASSETRLQEAAAQEALVARPLQPSFKEPGQQDASTRSLLVW